MINNSITSEEFEAVLVSEPRKNKQLREGQVLMIYLFEYWREEYFRIVGTDLDCFYDDRSIYRTLAHLISVWDNRDAEIANRIDFSIDRSENKVNLQICDEISLMPHKSIFLIEKGWIDPMEDRIADGYEPFGYKFTEEEAKEFCNGQGFWTEKDCYSIAYKANNKMAKYRYSKLNFCYE